jgi:hypothetical protein
LAILLLISDRAAKTKVPYFRVGRIHPLPQGDLPQQLHFPAVLTDHSRATTIASLRSNPRIGRDRDKSRAS